MELYIRSIYKNEKFKGIGFLYNNDILPNHKEIDIIIKELERIKNKLTDKEIENNNQKQWQEFEKQKYEWFHSKKDKIRKKKIKGYIYLLKSKNLYKIGRALQIKDRIKTYKTENPFGIRVILQILVNDYIQVEKDLLEKFKEKNHRGEWFKFNKQDIDSIKKYLTKDKIKSK